MNQLILEPESKTFDTWSCLELSASQPCTKPVMLATQSGSMLATQSGSTRATMNIVSRALDAWVVLRKCTSSWANLVPAYLFDVHILVINCTVDEAGKVRMIIIQQQFSSNSITSLSTIHCTKLSIYVRWPVCAMKKFCQIKSNHSKTFSCK